jgi:hypothetical protein
MPIKSVDLRVRSLGAFPTGSAVKALASWRILFGDQAF